MHQQLSLSLEADPDALTPEEQSEWDALDWDALAAISARNIAKAKAAGTYQATSNHPCWRG